MPRFEITPHHILNDRLKGEADRLLVQHDLPQLFRPYREWFIGGSYRYDLMCWRDLDIYLLDDALDLRRCFDLGYELTRRLGAWKSRFTDSLTERPRGLYWGIKFPPGGAPMWKFDVWVLPTDEYRAHIDYCDRLARRLDPEGREAILNIKAAYWHRPEYRDTVTSDLIYRAVLDDGVRGVPDFEAWLRGMGIE